MESRCVLSSIAGGGDFHSVIVAGDPSGTPADSPADRVDANAASSPFAGVGSLQINARRGTFICTATPIDDTHVLTAGHCVDLNDDGRSDKKDGILSIYFQLNLDVDSPTDQVDVRLKAASWQPNPDFTGFNRPSVNDDLAIVTLSAPLPGGVPIYALTGGDMSATITRLVMVGYGRSGDGVSGYTTDASWTVKRRGENMVDAFYTQDDATKPAANEVFRFDFDGPDGSGALGDPTLGNDLETTLGGGDSGGPSFRLVDAAHPELASSYELVGVNTFTQGFNAPQFGSLGGGINIYPYLGWIQSVLTGGGSGGGSGGGGHGPFGKSSSALEFAVLAGLPLEHTTDSLPALDSRVEADVTGDHQTPLVDRFTTLITEQPRGLVEQLPIIEAPVPSSSLLMSDRESESIRDEWFAEFDALLDPSLTGAE